MSSSKSNPPSNKNDSNNVSPTGTSMTRRFDVEVRGEVNSCHQKLLPVGHVMSEWDILCSCNGKRVERKEWPGNQWYMNLLQENLMQYKDAPKRVKKSAVIVSILDKISSAGARFIKFDRQTGRYCELTSDQIYEKTSNSIWTIVRNLSKDNSSSVVGATSSSSSCKRSYKKLSQQKSQPKQHSKSMPSSICGADMMTARATGDATSECYQVAATAPRLSSQPSSHENKPKCKMAKKNACDANADNYDDDTTKKNRNCSSTKRSSLPINLDKLSDEIFQYHSVDMLDDLYSSPLSSPCFSPIP